MCGKWYAWSLEGLSLGDIEKFSIREKLKWKSQLLRSIKGFDSWHLKRRVLVILFVNSPFLLVFHSIVSSCHSLSLWIFADPFPYSQRSSLGCLLVGFRAYQIPAHTWWDGVAKALLLTHEKKLSGTILQIG